MPEGKPKSDTERIMSHYGVSRAEANANPELYPLPERGSGLGNKEEGFTIGHALILAVISFIIYKTLWGRKA